MYKKDFPIFEKEKNLVFLDSGASALKPKVVIDTLFDFLSTDYSNIHRGVYRMSVKSTEMYEESKRIISEFINCSDSEIVYTRGATECLNLLAHSLPPICEDRNEIVITETEHHANMVPWQQLQSKGYVLKYIPLLDDGSLRLDYEKAREIIGDKTAIVSFVHISNVTGIENDYKQLIEIAHNSGAYTIMDCAQSIVHRKIDAKEFGTDFLVFSGHKLYGPSGVGVLYGKRDLLDKMPVFNTGGDMIKKVTYKDASFANTPQKFEAGTPNIEGAVGLGSAIKYLMKIGMDKVEEHEKEIHSYAVSKFDEIGIKYLPTDGSLISFNMKAHPHDIASLLDDSDICIRAGHHCAMPLMDKLDLPGTARVSFGIYNTKEDVDKLIKRLIEIKKIFGEE